MKKLLVALLTGLTMIGLVGCGQTPIDVQESTKQVQTEESREQRIANKANKALELLSFQTAPDGQKYSEISSTEFEQIRGIWEVFGNENLDEIGRLIKAREPLTSIKMTALYYEQFTGAEQKEIEAKLDKVIELGSNDVITILNSESEVEQPKVEQSKQETPKVEQEQPQQQDDTDTYKQVIGRCEDFVKDVNFLAPQIETSSDEGDFNTVISYCNTLLDSYQDLRDYQLGSDLWVPVDAMINNISTIKSYAEQGDPKGVYTFLVMLQSQSENLKAALY
ncbi:TPA: lipoprotein [Clostridium perfringens]|nr:hypothetical protein [Clostridium perfringens]MDM0556530.1 hypothetical protein [Clostridium perfringens]MDU3663524.1 hypothetical protein [Clostridium perfringens]